MFKKMRVNKILHRAIAVGMAVSMLVLPGCSASESDLPELLAPKVMNESFRPVGYTDIGDIFYCDGYVVPTDYCHFWKKGTSISEINVNLGQYVEKGDLLATADIKQTQEIIADINQQKERERKNNETACAIYEQNLQELEYRKQGCDLLKDLQGANQAATDIKLLEENHRYDQLLFEYKMKKYDRELSDYYEIIADGKLYARHSGYVTFCKNLKESNQVAGVENVVIVSDYEDCYIELPNHTVKETLVSKYDVIFTYRDGSKKTLKEYAYPNYELLAAEGREMYPNIRLKFEDETLKIQPGSSVPVYFGKRMKEDVLCVGVDSLYEDSQGHYVYVKNETGKEVRYIEIGEKDDRYVQVLSGLEEGEQIFYSSDSAMPVDYGEYIATSTLYEAMDDTDRIVKIMNKSTIMFSEYEGEIVEIVKDDAEEVEKDGVICKIKISEGSAALADLRNSMESLKTTHESAMESYDEQIEKLEELQKQPIEQTIEVPDENGNMKKKKQYIARPYFRGEVGCQIAVAKLRKEQAEREYQYQLTDLQERYSKASKNNDGTGIMSICAKDAGIIKDMNWAVGNRIEVGEQLCKVETPASPYVGLLTSDFLHINQKVTFIDEGIEERYVGKVIGLGGEALFKRVFLTTLDDGVYVSQGGDDGSTGGAWAYVLPEDEAYYTHQSLEGDKTASFAVKSVEGAFALPTGVLHSETELMTGEELFFVWKIEKDGLVKHYVDYIYSAVDEEGYRIDCVMSGINEGDVLAIVEGGKVPTLKISG